MTATTKSLIALIITTMVIAFFTNFSGFLIGLAVIGAVVGLPLLYIVILSAIQTIQVLRETR